MITLANLTEQEKKVLLSRVIDIAMKDEEAYKKLVDISENGKPTATFLYEDNFSKSLNNEVCV